MKININSKGEFHKYEPKSKLISWFFFIAGILVTLIIVYKTAISEIKFDFSNFDFNALLSLILALFAIALSIAFYFKATDTSNQFYDNTFRFTKEISEILGRIEAGFGERLRHLDEGYSGLINKFDRNHNEQNIQETKDEIEKEKQKLNAEIDQRNKILNNLIEKAQLEQHEKEDILRQLKEKEIEITKQNREITFLRSKLHNESEIEHYDFENLPESVKIVLIEFVKSLNNPELILKMPISMILRKYKVEFTTLTNEVLTLLINLRIVNDNGTLTVHGIRFLKQIVRKYLI